MTEEQRDAIVACDIILNLQPGEDPGVDGDLLAVFFVLLPQIIEIAPFFRLNVTYLSSTTAK